jgi:hypothetical protein
MSHSRKTNRDRTKKTQRPIVEDQVIATQLEALVTPAITAQENYYRPLGLRDPVLNLPMMVAALLTLMWPDVVGVSELTRILGRESFWLCTPTQICQPALS